MYCPSCSFQLTQSSSYCNRCGANLNLIGTLTSSHRNRRTLMLWLWVGVAANVVILGMILGSLVLMKDGTIAGRLGTAFAILASLSLLLIDGLIVWRALSGTRDINKRALPVN